MGTYKEEILNSLILRKFKGKIMPFGKNKEKNQFVSAIYVLFTFSNKQANIPHFKGKKLKSLYSERLQKTVYSIWVLFSNFFLGKTLNFPLSTSTFLITETQVLHQKINEPAITFRFATILLGFEEFSEVEECYHRSRVILGPIL